MLFGNKNGAHRDVEFFTIFDSKTKSYRDPMTAVNAEDMVRAVVNMMRDPNQAQNPLILNSEDYSLFRIGSFSRVNGVLETQNLEHIANFHDLRALAQPSPGIVAT